MQEIKAAVTHPLSRPISSLEGGYSELLGHNIGCGSRHIEYVLNDGVALALKVHNLRDVRNKMELNELLGEIRGSQHFSAPKFLGKTLPVERTAIAYTADWQTAIVEIPTRLVPQLQVFCRSLLKSKNHVLCDAGDTLAQQLLRSVLCEIDESVVCALVVRVPC